MEFPIWKSILKRKSDPLLEILNFLSHTSVFGGLPKRTLREIAKYLHRREYTPGEVIFRQGQAGAGVYFIFSGKVIVSGEREGLNLKFAELPKFSFFGELSLFSEEPRTATARAGEDTVLLGFFQPELETLLTTKPRIGNDILLRFTKVVAERLIKTNALLENAYIKGKRKLEAKK